MNLMVNSENPYQKLPSSDQQPTKTHFESHTCHPSTLCISDRFVSSSRPGKVLVLSLPMTSCASGV
nr:hypothetical protein Iba_chr10aCG15200 [Ipomoea batatas]GMD47567.1 hypothetical protein Iba_chr10eCG14190 [Ipomoea batatas]